MLLVKIRFYEMLNNEHYEIQDESHLILIFSQKLCTVLKLLIFKRSFHLNWKPRNPWR